MLAEGATQAINQSMESGKAPLHSRKMGLAVTRAAWEWKFPREILEACAKICISPAYNPVFFKPALPKLHCAYKSLGDLVKLQILME